MSEHTCFQCGDGNTPLYCLNCANDMAKSSLAQAPDWGAWAKHPWNVDEPACVRCGTGITLRDGCEWHDWPELNMCSDCLVTTLEELRPNAPAQAFPTGQQLAEVLQRNGIVQSQAIDDPEGYDNYETLEAVNSSARELHAMQSNHQTSNPK